jgi:predicted HTH transcriptional regulator
MNLIPSNNFNSTPDKSTKKHNTASTSREAYASVVQSGKTQREREIVYQAISNSQPITSRKLSEITKIERTNITRSLYDLLREQPVRIKEAYVDRCPVTKKRVKYYTLIIWPQTSLFTN